MNSLRNVAEKTISARQQPLRQDVRDVLNVHLFSHRNVVAHRTRRDS
jgi:hypothetical protein